jgi:hypothetical protein
MNFLERDLEDLIWEAYKKDPDNLRKRGLRMSGTPFRQLNLGSYGISDIVTVKMVKQVSLSKENNYRGTDRIITINVYELKKDIINTDTFLQALGYCKGIQKIANEYYSDFFTELRFNITLIGKTLDLKSNFCYISDFIDNVNLYTYHADLDKGFVFEQRYDFHLSKESIAILNKEDKTKLKNMFADQLLEVVQI